MAYYQRARISLGTRVEREPASWVDANFADLLPMRTLAGDVRAALAGPDGIVISLSTARRWFGEDSPIDRTLTVNDRVVTVRAIIEEGVPAMPIPKAFAPEPPRKRAKLN